MKTSFPFKEEGVVQGWRMRPRASQDLRESWQPCVCSHARSFPSGKMRIGVRPKEKLKARLDEGCSLYHSLRPLRDSLQKNSLVKLCIAEGEAGKYMSKY